MERLRCHPALSGRERKIVEEIALANGLSPETAEILFARGLDSADKAYAFLNPGRHRFHDPFLLSGMKACVERLERARREGERALVYGDYDADGVSAAAILYRALRKFGVEALTVVPERENGYGLNLGLVEAIAEETAIDLVITVDCGISNREEISELMDLGMDVIVTDHHEIPPALPECVCINPHLPGQDYPFDSLCGAGVAFKLACALLGEEAYSYLDFAAVATVADSMPLVGENRDIVFEGLKMLGGKRVRPAMKYLLSSNKDREVNAQTLAYVLAPRINAAGRMGDANAALSLFLSEDENEIADLAARLSAYNLERQAECDKLYQAAKAQLEKKGAYGNIIMLYDETWATGFVGIVAARLAEEYARPVIMFAGQDGRLKGSARSVDGINIFEVISSQKALLREFGGHAQAAGVSVERENFEAFEAGADAYIAAHCDPSAFQPVLSVERMVDRPLTAAFVSELNRLEPCGVGNKKPLFATEIGSTDCSVLKQGTGHITFHTDCLDMIWFGGLKDADLLKLPVKKTVVFEANLSVFGRSQSLRGYVKELLMPEKPGGGELGIYLLANALSQLQYETFGQDDRPLGEAETHAFVAEALARPHGAVFFAARAETLAAFPELEGLPVSVYKPPERNLLNAVVLSPKEEADFGGFACVIWLDRPLKGINVGGDRPVYYNCERAGIPLDGIRADRDACKRAVAEMKARAGKPCAGSADFYFRYRPAERAEQFVFAFEVFCELGFFSVESGVLRYFPAVRRDLADSAIYRFVGD